MINYQDLTPTQKRAIDAMVLINPLLSTARRITRQEIEDCWYQMLLERKPGVKKIGYPAFLLKGTKLGRGLYYFPGPDVIQEDQDEVEFYEELQEWGIEF